MKNLHLHILWAIAAAALAALASAMSRRTDIAAAPPGESRTVAGLRTRVAELEAELDRRQPPAEPPVPVPVKAPEPKGDAPAAAAPALSIDQIRALLKSTNRDDQARAIKEIEGMTDRSQKLTLLREMLNSGSSSLASRAVSILKKMGGSDAVAMILDVLTKDGPSGPRTQAALALGELGDASAIPALQEAWRSGDLQLRTAAAVGLDHFGQREPVQATLQTFAGMLDSADGGAREDAVDLMTKIPVPGSLPLLAKALTDSTNNHLREDAADAMGAQRLTDSLPYLEKALLDPSANVREAAQRAINRIKAPKP